MHHWFDIGQDQEIIYTLKFVLFREQSEMEISY